MIAHGDYCDSSVYVNSNSCKLTSKVGKLKRFVENSKPTGGGDSPEANKYTLYTVRKHFDWSDDASKPLVMIGDNVPHPPSYTNLKINWFKELDQLAS